MSSVGRSIKRRVDVGLGASITSGISQGKKWLCSTGLCRGGEHARRISPLAIINDGLRWHIRGYDHEHKKYKDFTLARFLSAEDGGESDISLADDSGWNIDVELQLEVHPEAKHPETVALDYDTEDGMKVVRIKSCMVGYFLRRWPIDFSRDAVGNPDEKHLYLKNRKDLLNAGVSEWALGGWTFDPHIMQRHTQYRSTDTNRVQLWCLQRTLNYAPNFTPDLIFVTYFTPAARDHFTPSWFYA